MWNSRFRAQLISGFLVTCGLLSSIYATNTIAIEPFTRNTWAQLTARSQTTPLVVMFWSLDCPHCGSNMALLNRFKPPLQLVTVATDALELTPELQHRLRQYAAGGRGFALNFAFADTPERLRYSVDRSWRGELPVLYMLRAGAAPERLTGQIDAAQLSAVLTASAKASSKP